MSVRLLAEACGSGRAQGRGELGAPDDSRRRAGIVRLFVLVVLVAGLAVGVVTGLTPGIDDLRGWVELSGPAAPALFVVVCAVACVALVPKPLLSIAGGVMFGPALGAGVVVAGVTLGALASFGVARLLGGRAVLGGTGAGRLARLDGMFERRGFWAVVVLRLMPVVPFGVVNYAAGLSALRVGAFGLGTAIGVLPATVLYTSTVASLGTMTVGEWLFVGTVLGVLGLLGWRLTRTVDARVGHAGAPTAVVAVPPADLPPGERK